MRFQATHKLVTYLLVLSAFAALASTDAISAPVAGVFLAAWALSWVTDPGQALATAMDRIVVPVRALLLGLSGWTAFQVWQRLPEPDLAPVLELVLALLGYKLLHRRGNRDYLHIYVLSFLLVLAASALAGSFLYALAFALYVVLATWTLILFHLRREMEENYLVKHSAQAPSQKVGVGRILNSRRVVGGSFFAATGLAALGVFAGSVVTFALVPRVGAGFVFGAARPTENLIGFSDDVTLGRYGVLSAENQAVALRATIPRIAALPGEPARDAELDRLYWRGTVYDRYDHGHWTRSRDPVLATVLEDSDGRTVVREPVFEPPGAGDGPAARRARDAALASAERQEIDVIGLPIPVVFALDHPIAYELPAGTAGGLGLAPRWSGEVALRLTPFAFAPGRDEAGRPSGAALAPGEGPAGSAPALGFLGARYVAYSSDGLARARAGAGRPVAALPAAARAAYLALPRSFSPRVAQLAEWLTAGKASPPTRMTAILDWLRATHVYSARLPHRQPYLDPVEDFLFNARAGHCEYFASAMVVLLRAAGIPARYVNGYLGGEWNEVGKYVAVRDNRAHSWAEAYLGDLGWVRVDATPPVPAQARAGKVRQLVESVDFYWTRWIVGYDLSRQLELARRVGRRLGIGGAPGPTSRRLPGLVLVLAAVAALAVAASRRWSRALPAADAALPTRAGERDTPVQRLYRRALARLDSAGFPRRPAETPREFALRVADAQLGGSDVLEQLTELYTAARFGGRDIEGDVLRDVARRLPRLGRVPPSLP
jgi:protein-glutamine gamma-glutamyltransferase